MDDDPVSAFYTNTDQQYNATSSSSTNFGLQATGTDVFLITDESQSFNDQTGVDFTNQTLNPSNSMYGSDFYATAVVSGSPEVFVSAVQQSDAFFSDTVLSEPIKEIEKAVFFEISISETVVKADAGVGSYVAYQIHTKTTLDLYKSNELTVFRRFSDFLWLHEQLSNVHRAIIIPTLPEKSSMTAGKLSIGGARYSKAFVEYRRRELERFLRRVTSHPVLCTSKYLQSFLEIEDSAQLLAIKTDEVKVAASPGFFARLTGPKATEVDQWFETKRKWYQNLAKQLEAVVNATTQLITKHMELANLQLSFSSACQTIVSIEEKGTVLNRAFQSLNEINTEYQMLEHELVEGSTIQFDDALKDYVRMIVGIDRIFEFRLEKLAEFQSSVKDFEMKKQRSKSKPDNEPFKTQSDAAEQKMEESKESFQTTSDTVKSEIDRFETTRTQDLIYAVENYAQLHMNHEIRVLDLWKRFINDLK